jgi:hypothetical protein
MRGNERREGNVKGRTGPCEGRECEKRWEAMRAMYGEERDGNIRENEWHYKIMREIRQGKGRIEKESRT